MQDQRDKTVRDVFSATMWAAEKFRVALRKVKEQLVRLMTDKSFCVSGINIKVKVSSFRLGATGRDTDCSIAESVSQVDVFEADRMRKAEPTTASCRGRGDRICRLSPVRLEDVDAAVGVARAEAADEQDRPHG
jgi:hypothetical protein